jgi:hypothetical protein
MGKKKKRKLEQKPYCWYCQREFDDEKILIQHQKAKHFKCHICHKKLTTAGGMVVHVYQVHKENITKVPNAKPGRDSIQYEIYGMEGIPEGDGAVPGDNPAGDPSIGLSYPMPGTTIPGAPLGFGGPQMGIPSTNLPGNTLQMPPGGPMPLPQGPLPMGVPPLVGGPGMPPMAPPFGIPRPMGPGPMGMPVPMWGGPNPQMPWMGPPINAPPVTSPAAMGTPAPLFPVGASPTTAMGAGAPVGGFGVQSPRLGVPAAAPQGQLIYDDENMSMEEKRAELDKYRYDEEKIKEQVNRLNTSIESRLSNMKGFSTTVNS